TSVKYIPVSEVGGDIYSIEELKNGDLQIFLADATGHGVQGALITMLIYAEYLYCKSIAKEPAEIIKLLNDTIATKYRNLDVYFSCVVAHIHFHESKLLFASGGHIEQFLLHANKEISTLKATGNLVGFQLKSTYKQVVLPFQLGDLLFLFTDGIVDEFDTHGRDYGIERFKQRILKSADKPLFQIISDVINDVEKFLEYSPFQDDITILGIRFQQQNEKTKKPHS
ncbi:MAG: serine/threonine-protein phosphatase, partial [Leptospiraceae bacterium]|nr:serine/threonine-protein phosphatase [Leptospiraceae bacterium]